jgi:hypothetical protein
MPTQSEREVCQADVVTAASQPMGKLHYLLRRAIRLGAAGCLERLRLRTRRKPARETAQIIQITPYQNAAEKPRVVETLGLQAGDIVTVLSEEEIRRTLDASGRCKGLLFMPDMSRYCGQRMVVYKRLQNILMETTGEMRGMKNTVLLQDAICDGWHGACDRSCYYFWREAWLKRADV